MTYTEKILNLIELNENVPTLVTDEESGVVCSNRKFSTKFGHIESGKSFLKIFDTNSSLLVKSSFLDSKVFQKVEKRDVTFEKDNQKQVYKLIISPFKFDSKLYFYNLLIDENETNDELVIYPSLQDSEVLNKYEAIISRLNEPELLTNEDDTFLQDAVDNYDETIVIINKSEILLTNQTFNQISLNENKEKDSFSSPQVFNEKLLSKIELAENEIFISNIPFIVEKKDPYDSSNNPKVLLYPITENNGEVDKIIIVGDLKVKNKSTEDEPKIKFPEKITSISKNENEMSSNPKIIYDRNNLDILDANLSAAKLYGYDLEELKNMNVTQLFPPEEMQKLLLPVDAENKLLFNQLKKDGSQIEVNVQREKIIFDGKEAFAETIFLNEIEEEVIELEEFPEAKKSEEIVHESKIEDSKKVTKESKSDFLSSMFHELLTPVNVILGFVQEIIDSVDNPTEEQSESAKIIKDNQQILLQAMNTAVQFAQLDENKIKIRIEEFVVNNYIVDLQDSISRVSEKENVEVVFNDIPDSLTINHDRAKLLAALSYFINFVVKLTDLSKIYVSFRIINNNFYVFVKDSYNGISENVSANILDLYYSQSVKEKKNYQISPIAVRLAKKLNEMLSIEIKDYFDPDGSKSLAFITPINFVEQSAAITEKSIVEETENKIDSILEDVNEDEIENDIQVEEDDFIDESEIIENEGELEDNEEIYSEEIYDEGHSQIANGEVDKKIVEDIEEEEEIITEEIASLESEKEVETVKISDLSCLFIDDSVDAQLLFKSQMNDLKMLKVCSNLTEALPLLTKYQFDVIVVDINLNDKYNGLDALKIIRQFANYTSTPIIAVTAYSFEGDKDKFLNFGFTDYFVKPLLKEQILESLSKILS
ncbi:MAG: response regulator [Ignavibacteriales bacterium]|nr:response regulator [Ignavibacteriales bacterium]